MALQTMPRSGNSSTSLREKDVDDMQEDDGNMRREEQARFRERIRNDCRLILLEEADRRDSILTRRDAAEWLTAMEEQNLQGADIRTEADKTEVVRELFETLYSKNVIGDARQAGREALRLITDAEEKKWIRSSSAKEWRDRVKDESSSCKEKKEFIEKTLPEWYANWARIASDYKQVLKQEKELNITKEDIAAHTELSAFHDTAMMSGKLKYPERRWRIDTALDFLKKFERKAEKKGEKSKEELAARARGKLMEAVHAKAVDEGKAMEWLQKRVLCKPLKDLEKYIAVDLHEYVKSCIKTRVDFDFVHGQMDKAGVPRGFNRITLTRFLALTLNQRKGYVEQARQGLKLKDAPSPGAMENLKLGIRSALDTKDWEEAEDLLTKARLLLAQGTATERDRYELDSMERNIRNFREKENKEHQPKEDAEKTLAGMRAAFAKIEPQALQSLYLRTMNDGPECFSRFCQLLRNREWVTQHGYSDTNLEKLREERAKEETKDRAKGAHSKKEAEYIHLGVVDDPEHSAAVRRYDQGEWAPTYIFMPHNSQGKLLEILRERKDNYAFGYWTTLIPTGVTYEQQLHLIHDVNRTLKSGMYKLREQGFAFSPFGPPVPLN